MVMLSILAVLAAPGHCQVAAGLGIWMATRHPGVRRWQVETVDRPQEINATTSHTYRLHAPGGGLPLPLLHQRSVDFLGDGDVRVRPIAQGGVELPGGMAGREAIVQLLGLRSQLAGARPPATQSAPLSGRSPPPAQFHLSQQLGEMGLGLVHVHELMACRGLSGQGAYGLGFLGGSHRTSH